MSFFFFNDTATAHIYTLSLHDALPISPRRSPAPVLPPCPVAPSRRPHTTHERRDATTGWEDRKSTRLNSSHVSISYAVFCLKKKKTVHQRHRAPAHPRVRGHPERDAQA